MMQCSYEGCKKIIEPGESYIYHSESGDSDFCSHVCADEYDRQFRSVRINNENDMNIDPDEEDDL